MAFSFRKKLYWAVTALVLPVVFAIFAACATTSHTQNLTIYEHEGIVERLEGDFAVRNINSEQRAFEALDALKDVYGFGNVYEEFVLTKALENAGGYVLQLDQYYNGFYVFPRQIKLSLDKDFNIKAVYGNYLKDINPINPIAITQSDAISILQNHQDLNVLYTRTVVYTYLGHTAVYAYELTTDLGGGANFYIEAFSGEILRHIDTSKEIEPYVSTQTDYRGNSVEIVIAKDSNNDYALMDGYRNINVMYSTVSESLTGTVYTNKTGIFDDTSKNENVAISALVNVQNAFDFYTNADNIGVSTYGVDNSVLINIFGEAIARREKQVNLIIYVDTRYNNAFCASNTPNQYYTTLAFGDRRLYGIAQDVVAHEYQHSVNNYNANLIYENASGAIDEALADMFASLVEGHSMDTNAFWDMGEEMGYASRSAIDPEIYWGQRGTVANQFPFCYESGGHETHMYCDNGGVHYNATIITNSFYQMYLYAKDNGIDTFTKKNLGTIMYSALSKLTPDSTWVQLADAVCMSVEDLGLSQQQNTELLECIRYGFGFTGIYELGNHQSKIDFKLGDYHTGTVPAAIVGEVDSTFVIPESNVSRTGGTFVGWTKTPNSITEDGIYYVGVEYTIPQFGITLYPISHMPKWNNFVFSGWQGVGSEQSPYLITNKNDLAALAYQMNVGLPPLDAQWQTIENKHFKLTSNIDLEMIPWEPIGLDSKLAKTIYFDGNNRYIRNFKLATETLDALPEYARFQGLFGQLLGEVKNLGIRAGSVNIKAASVGGIAGVILSGGRVSNCYYEGTLYNTYESGAAGGIAGKAVHRNIKGGVITASANTAAISGDFAGGIVGQVVGALYGSGYNSYDNVTIIGNCINSGIVGGKMAGGIVSTADNVVLVNCINDGNIRGTGSGTFVGGLIGYLNYEANFINPFSAILSCRNAGTVQKGSGTSSLGGIAGAIRSTKGSILFDNNVINDQSGVGASGNGTVEQLSPAQVRFSLDYDNDFNFVSMDTFLDKSNWTIANGISNLDFLGWLFEGGRNPSPASNAVFWDEEKASAFESGSGTVGDPYIISTAEQLALLLYNVNNDVVASDQIPFSQKHYRQTADIDLHGKLWTGIGYSSEGTEVAFEGTYNGGGYSIANLYATERTELGKHSSAALFSGVGGESLAEIRGVRLVDCSIQGKEGAAGIAYSLTGKAKIIDCIATGDITAENIAGGIAGMVNAKGEDIEISSCLNMANISSPIAAGILSSAEAIEDGKLKIENSVNRGEVTSYFLSGYYMQSAEGDNITAGILAISGKQVDIISCINTAKIANHGYGYSSGILGFLANGTSYIMISGTKQTAAIHSMEDGNSASIVSQAKGTYSGVSISKTHYRAGTALSIINTLTSTNCVATSDEAGVGDFWFADLSYFKNGIYFDVTANTYHLYRLLSYEKGYVFASFVGADGVIFEVKKVEAGGTVTLPTTNPTKESTSHNTYQFASWNKPAGTIMVDTIFNAEFTEATRQYTITYKDPDGSTIETKQSAYGETLSLLAPTKKGYTFEGWYRDAALTQRVDSLEVTEDTTLYANWQKNSGLCSTITPNATMFLPLMLLPLLPITMIVRQKRQRKVAA